MAGTQEAPIEGFVLCRGSGGCVCNGRRASVSHETLIVTVVQEGRRETAFFISGLCTKTNRISCDRRG